MKILFVKLLAMTAGIVVGLSMVGIGLFWFTHHRQPPKLSTICVVSRVSWDSNAITAKLIKYALFERNDKPNWSVFS